MYNEHHIRKREFISRTKRSKEGRLGVLGGIHLYIYKYMSDTETRLKEINVEIRKSKYQMEKASSATKFLIRKHLDKQEKIKKFLEKKLRKENAERKQISFFLLF